MQDTIPLDAPKLSATTKLLKCAPFNDDKRYNVAFQVLHNLQFQQQWTSLSIHPSTEQSCSRPSTHPLISGLPSTRLYIHPDEMVAHVTSEQRIKEKQRLKGQASQQGYHDTLGDRGLNALIEQKDDPQAPLVEPGSDDTEIVIDDPQREWVIPTHVHEPWTLGRLAAIFDNMEDVPPEPGEGIDVTAKKKIWPRTKRAILAIIADDSTVVYYIVHEGLVKPRQN